MRTWSHVAGALRLGAMLLMAAIAGCTISIQPWTKPIPPPPPNPQVDPLNPNMMMKNGTPPRSPAANNEETALLEQRRFQEEELRNSLQAQIVHLKKQLKDRDGDVQKASYEIEESTKQIKRTREEFRQWQSEMEELRDRIRKLEDYRANAKPLIDDIYRFLDRDKEPKSLKLTVPK